MFFIDELPCALVVTDRAGRILRANKELQTITIREVETWIGRGLDELFVPASRIFLQTHVWPTLLRDDAVLEIYLKVQDAHQQHIPVILNGRRVMSDEQQSFVWTLFAARQRSRFEQELLAARKSAEHAARSLSENNRFINSITDSIPSLVAYWDKNLVCRFANRHYLDWFGRPADAMLGMQMQDILDGHLFKLNESIIRGALSGYVQRFERELARADGEIRHTIATYIPDIADGEVVGFYSCINDITELKKTQKDLERTGRLAGVGGWEVDLRNSTISWSDVVCQIHGVEPGKVPLLDEAIEYFTPPSQTLIKTAINQALETGSGYDLELEIIRRDGDQRWVRTIGTVEKVDGQPVRLSGAFQDITEIKRLAIELAEYNELLTVTLQSIGDAVITTDDKGLVTWLNPVAERLTGWLSAEAKGLSLSDVFNIVNEETRLPVDNPVTICLAQGRIVGLANHTVLISRNGIEYGIEDSAAPIRNDTGQIFGVVLVFRDVSEQRRLTNEMSHRASHDVLTGIFNRAEFEARLARVLRRAHEEQSQHAMLYVDLDQFKLVNDACGHHGGDQLLQQVSRLFNEAVRTSDTLARLGGDEFAIILEYCDQEDAFRIAQKICDRMDDYRFVQGDHRFRIGTSIGLVPIDNRWKDPMAILQAADMSCYAAKEAGRNRVHVWLETDATLHARHTEMQWTNRIEKALDEDGFALYIQQIQPLSGASKGFHVEALLRMQAGDGSLLAPGVFLPAAERFNLAARVDRWVLKKSIEWIEALPSHDLIETLSVNLSGQTVGDRSFQTWAIRRLDEAGPEVRSKLCLEITETATVTNLPDAASFIAQVRSTGLKVALDDFGAGASSFGYLKSLPVDYLKIDGRFIRDLMEHPLDEVTVRSFVAVAKVVGVKTVAEYVDNQATMERLREIGVDFAQGFHIHRPEPINSIFSWARPE